MMKFTIVILCLIGFTQKSIAQKAYMDPIFLYQSQLDECVEATKVFDDKEKTVCYQTALDNFEALMNKHYIAIQNSEDVSGTVKSKIKSEQLDWLTERNQAIQEKQNSFDVIDTEAADLQTTKLKVELTVKRIKSLQEYCNAAGISVFDY